MTKRLFGSALILGFLLIWGCGLHVSGKDWEAKTGIKSIAIPVLTNTTQRSHVESTIASAIVDEFSSFITIAEDEESADAVLRGVVRKYELIPVSYDFRDVALEYELRVTLSFTLKRVGDGRVLWKHDSIYGREDFLVDTDSVAVTKELERDALRALSLEVARLVRERIVEDIVENISKAPKKSSDNELEPEIEKDKFEKQSK